MSYNLLRVFAVTKKMKHALLLKSQKVSSLHASHNISAQPGFCVSFSVSFRQGAWFPVIQWSLSLFTSTPTGELGFEFF